MLSALSQVLQVEFVHNLDDGLLGPAAVLALLRDGHHADAFAPQHGFDGDGVLALPGEPGESADQYLLEWAPGFTASYSYTTM